MDGNATFTTVMSSNSMNVAVHTVIKVHHLRSSPGTGPPSLSLCRMSDMVQGTQFTIGAAANCTDGPCGEVIRVVIDPVAETVTHLVVEPEHRSGLGRLVPLELVDASAAEVQLRC